MMTNKARFKQAFSTLHTSDDFVLDLEEKSMIRKMKFRKTLIAACTALAICASGITCYAADLGGIQRTIQVWFHGDQTAVTLTVDNGKVTHYRIKDANGNEEYGGGIAGDGKDGERALTDSEIQEDLDDPGTEIVNGRLYLYYKDQKIDLTDHFNKDDICFVKLKNGNKTLYVTVAPGGLSTNEDRYIQKNEMPKAWFHKK